MNKAEIMEEFKKEKAIVNRLPFLVIRYQGQLRLVKP